MDKAKLSECKEFIDFTIKKVNFYYELFKEVDDEFNSRMHTIKLKRDPKNKTINLIVYDDINHTRDMFHKFNTIDDNEFMRDYWTYDKLLAKLGDPNEINNNDDILAFCKAYITNYNSELTITDNLKVLWEKLWDKSSSYSYKYMEKVGDLQENAYKIIRSYEFSGYTVYVDGSEYDYYSTRRRIGIDITEKLEHLEETINNKLRKEAL